MVNSKDDILTIVPEEEEGEKEHPDVPIIDAALIKTLCPKQPEIRIRLQRLLKKQSLHLETIVHLYITGSTKTLTVLNLSNTNVSDVEIMSLCPFLKTPNIPLKELE